MITYMYLLGVIVTIIKIHFIASPQQARMLDLLKLLYYAMLFLRNAIWRIMSCTNLSEYKAKLGSVAHRTWTNYKKNCTKFGLVLDNFLYDFC